jgi:hypothetical protein
LRSAQHQMVMIAHQNPRINKPSGLFASFTKGLNEHPSILVASDNALSAVTSRHHMVHRALKLDSDLSRHSLPPWRRASAMPASIAASATGPMQATTRRPGSSWIWAYSVKGVSQGVTPFRPPRISSVAEGDGIRKTQFRYSTRSVRLKQISWSSAYRQAVRQWRANVVWLDENISCKCY